MIKNKKLLILGLIVVVFGFICFKMIPLIRNDFTHFDKTLWEKYPEKRYKMIEDFEKCYPAYTLSKEKVVFLLGRNNMTETENMFSYVVNSSVLFVDSYAIIFDEDERCVKRFRYRD